MRVRFLGTAAAEGWPAVFCRCEPCRKARKAGGRNVRTRSSVLFNSDLKVDLPPDTYMHVLRFGIDLGSLRYLLITHTHQDHFYVEELQMRKPPFAYIEDSHPLEVYGNRLVYEKIVNSLTSSETVKPYVVKPLKPFRLRDYEVEALPANHSADEMCLLYTISLGDTTVFYGHDSGWYPDETWKALKRRRLSLAILDCTCIVENCVNYHMGVETMVRAKNRMLSEGIANGDTVFIATHFSHNGRLLHHELEEALKPHDITPAYDGMELNI